MAGDWSALPLDLLTTVAFKLEFFEDFICFSAVCQSWNHASFTIKHQWRPTSVVPWLLLAENTQDNPDCVRKIFNLNNNKSYNLHLPETFGARCWGSAYGWIAMVGHDFNVQLFNPITKASISFPQLSTLPHLLEYDEERFKDKKDYCHYCLWYILTKLVVLKVSKSGNHEFVIMVLHSLNAHVAWARPGENSWTSGDQSCMSMVPKEPRDGIVDVIGMDDYVFALYNDGAIRYWDTNKLFNNLEGIVQPMDHSPGWFNTLRFYEEGWDKAYLVQSGKNLLLVVRYKDQVLNSDQTDVDNDLYYETLDFEAYKFNPKDTSWEQIGDLGDVALFVGGNYSMCVTIGAKSLERNCIYFTDDQNEDWTMMTEFGGHDMGIYDIKCDEIRQFYEGMDTRSSYCPPIWFVPQF